MDYQHFDILLVDTSPDGSYLSLLKEKGIPAIKGKQSEDVRNLLVENRNILREKFLKGKYDFFFSLEQDVIPEPDALKRLLSHNKDIVAGIYLNTMRLKGKNVLLPLAFHEQKKFRGRLVPLKPEEIKSKKLLEIDACGLGCTLIKRKVLENITFQHVGGFDDFGFCQAAKKAGFTIYADTAVRAKHYAKPWLKLEGDMWKQ